MTLVQALDIQSFSVWCLDISLSEEMPSKAESWEEIGLMISRKGIGDRKRAVVNCDYCTGQPEEEGEEAKLTARCDVSAPVWV